YTRADEGTIHLDLSNRVISVVLYNAASVVFQEGQNIPRSVLVGTTEFSYTNAVPAAKRRRVDVSDMTFCQLMDELDELENRFDATGPTPAANAGELR